MAFEIKEVDFISDGFIEIDNEFYVNQKSYDEVWKLLGDTSRKSIIMYEKLTDLGIDVEKLISDEIEKFDID